MFVMTIAAVFVAFAGCKFALNYSGVCTEGPFVWHWQRVTANDLQAVLRERGTSNKSIHTAYSLPDVWEIQADSYRSATLSDKIRGGAATLVRYHQPWLDDGIHLISTGYFYAPNCIGGWTPPE